MSTMGSGASRCSSRSISTKPTLFRAVSNRNFSAVDMYQVQPGAKFTYLTYPADPLLWDYSSPGPAYPVGGGAPTATVIGDAVVEGAFAGSPVEPGSVADAPVVRAQRDSERLFAAQQVNWIPGDDDERRVLLRSTNENFLGSDVSGFIDFTRRAVDPGPEPRPPDPRSLMLWRAAPHRVARVHLTGRRVRRRHLGSL